MRPGGIHLLTYASRLASRVARIAHSVCASIYKRLSCDGRRYGDIFLETKLFEGGRYSYCDLNWTWKLAVLGRFENKGPDNVVECAAQTVECIANN